MNIFTNCSFEALNSDVPHYLMNYLANNLFPIYTEKELQGNAQENI